MEGETTRKSHRQRYFEMVKAWAEAALAGEEITPAFSIPFRDPACREVLVRLRAVEEALERSGRCLLAGSEGEPDLTGLLVGPLGLRGAAAKPDGLRELRDFTRGVERLVIVDPYAYGGEGATAATTYVDELAKAARVDGPSLKELHIIFSSKHGKTKAIIEGIAERAAQASVRLTDFDTDAFHDRVWIADRSRGLVVGTSFGGLGSRAAFLLELPEGDLKHVLEFIDSNELMKGQARRPKRTTIQKRRSR